MNDSELSVGICGLGDRMACVLKHFAAEDKRFRIVGYVDPDPRGLDIMRNASIDVGTSYSSLEGLLESESLDLLMVGSPNAFHLEQIRTGLAHGVRVFTEKPVVINENETFELLADLNKYGVDRVLVGLVLRYAPLYRDIRMLQKKGVIGDVISMDANENLAPEHGAFFMRDWRRYEALTGGFLLEKCCHDLDLYRSIVGSRAISVASFGGRGFFTENRKYLEDEPVYHQRDAGWSKGSSVFAGDADIVDHQTAIIEFENGASMTFHSNINAPATARSLSIYGSNGMIDSDFERNFITAYDARSSDQIFNREYEFDENESHYGAEVQMAKDVLRHLFDDAPLPVSIIDALEAGLTAIKIDEARHTRSVIDLRETWRAFDNAVKK